MGKPTGFMEYEREPAHDRAPAERVKDWNEFHPPVPDETLRIQGARCMDCGLPFCHTGKLIAGMASGCPINNLIPEWNDLVYKGQWQEALIRLQKTNNFAEFTGRVCPAPCEGSCTVGMNGDAVTIKSIEVSIIDRAFAEGWVKPDRPQTRTGFKVAVIGSGPAGLACAAQLNRAGHLVTVFERADRVGGLLMYGIPNMKLDKGIVQRRVNLMADSGIRFITGTEVGTHIPVRRILNDYDAAVLCIGATKARDLSVDGRSLHGIHLAMDFLSKNTRSLLDSGLGDGRYISAAGRDVVVIGGGDTGTDCVGTSIRHGARSVTQFEILPQSPARRAADNPWPQWPRIHRTDYGQEEAAALFGKDPRIFGISTKKFVGDAQGRVKELHTVRVEWVKDAEGRFGPKEIPGSEQVVKADLVLLALGFTGPERTGAVAELGVKLDERGNVWTDDEKSTSVPGVFAAGDASRGQSLVVWAIQEGRRAARGVDRFLMQGESYLPG